MHFLLVFFLAKSFFLFWGWLLFMFLIFLSLFHNVFKIPLICIRSCFRTRKIYQKFWNNAFVLVFHRTFSNSLVKKPPRSSVFGFSCYIFLRNFYEWLKFQVICPNISSRVIQIYEFLRLINCFTSCFLIIRYRILGQLWKHSKHKCRKNSNFIACYHYEIGLA